MPITISICDDDSKQVAYLRELLIKWSTDKSFAIHINEYESAEEFLFDYPDNPCSLLLLDIEMRGINGMELAKKLRANGDILPIIFITGYSEYISDGYDVEALHYLLKPLNEVKLFAVLDKYTQKHKRSDRIVVPVGGENTILSADDIVFCEAFGKRIQISLKNGNEVLSTIGLTALSKKLDENFILCHRSYIVNLDCIRSISRTDITTDTGRKIPLSRRMYESVNRAFINYYREDKK